MITIIFRSSCHTPGSDAHAIFRGSNGELGSADFGVYNFNPFTPDTPDPSAFFTNTPISHATPIESGALNQPKSSNLTIATRQKRTSSFMDEKSSAGKRACLFEVYTTLMDF